MPRGRSNEDQAMLEMALIGYEHERERLDANIAELQARLKGKSAAPAKSAGGKRTVSPTARKRMAAAQKRRWAEYRKKSLG